MKCKHSALTPNLSRKALAVLTISACGLLVPSIVAQRVPDGNLAPGSQPLQFKRILGIVPVVEAPTTFSKIAPLSTGQKFEIFTRTTFDPGIIAVAAVGAGLSAQATVQPAYGGGIAAFGQKTGATAADYASNDLFSKALLPSLLHQDPRFVRKQDGRVGSRFIYGLSRTFITQTDSGHNTLNTSFLGGYAMSVALSNTYYPDSNRNASDSINGYMVGIGIDAAVNVFREFWNLEH